jgi:predicted DNA-binding transcriptional regulator AlpA
MPRAKQKQGEADTPIKLDVVPRRGLRREDAARYIGVSTAKFDECVKDGRMPQPFRIDGCVIWDLRRLDAAFDALSEPVEANTFDGWDDFT